MQIKNFFSNKLIFQNTKRKEKVTKTNKQKVIRKRERERKHNNKRR